MSIIQIEQLVRHISPGEVHQRCKNSEGHSRDLHVGRMAHGGGVVGWCGHGCGVLGVELVVVELAGVGG